MKKLLAWLGIGISVLIGLVLIGVASASALSSRRINRRYTPGVEYVAIPRDSAAIAHGRHLVDAIAKCRDCHGADLGGTMFIDDPAFGQIPAPNITRGTGGRTVTYNDIDYVRTLRHGVKPDGRSVIIMPSEDYTFFSDEDLGDLVAYLKSVPPVNRAWPAAHYGPVARGLMAFTSIPLFPAASIQHDRAQVIPPSPPDTTAAYGGYLTRVGGCQGCHNPSLSGGKIAGGDPKSPPAANLTRGGFGSLTEADFVRVLRDGKRPGTDQVIDNRYMPWRSSGLMTNDEIHAVWLYIQSIPSRELGQLQ